MCVFVYESKDQKFLGNCSRCNHIRSYKNLNIFSDFFQSVNMLKIEKICPKKAVGHSMLTRIKIIFQSPLNSLAIELIKTGLYPFGR